MGLPEAVTSPVGQPTSPHQGKILWLSSIRDRVPRSGAQIYSDTLAAAVAAHGFDVWLAGQLRDGEPRRTDQPAAAGTGTGTGLPLITTPFRPTRRLRRLLSIAPAMVAQTRRRQARRWLESILDDQWDAVVLSHLYTSWALPVLLRRRRRGDTTPIVYSSQNHETAIWRAAAHSPSLSLSQRLIRSIDWLRVARCERNLVRTVDGVVAISRADAAAHTRLGAQRVALARPALDEPITRTWPPIADRPRLVLVLGSVEWGLKLANLIELLEASHRHWASQGVRLAVAGRIDDRVLADLTSRFPTVELLGAVDDPATLYAQARAAVVHEPLGGGFKMKVLSYVAHGVPVIATAPSLEFDDPDIAELAIRVDDIAGLVERIPALLDDSDRLEAQRARAADVLDTVFSWDTAGEAVVALVRPR